MLSLICIFWVLQIQLFPTIRSERIILFLKGFRNSRTVDWRAVPFDLYLVVCCLLFSISLWVAKNYCIIDFPVAQETLKHLFLSFFMLNFSETTRWKRKWIADIIFLKPVPQVELYAANKFSGMEFARWDVYLIIFEVIDNFLYQTYIHVYIYIGIYIFYDVSPCSYPRLGKEKYGLKKVAVIFKVFSLVNRSPVSFASLFHRYLSNK